MNRRVPLVLIIAVGAGACASPSTSAAVAPPSPQLAPATPAPAPSTPSAAAPSSTVTDIDPVGTYSVNLTAQGNPLTVTAKIERRADGSFGGAVTSDVTPPLAINSVRVSGNTMRVSVAGPNGEEAILNLRLDGAQLSGDWVMGNDGSPVSGRKLP